MHDVYLIRIKEKTVSSLRNADCLLENTSIIHSKYVVNPKLEQLDGSRFRECSVRIKEV
jgi:hypothetical protein